MILYKMTYEDDGRGGSTMNWDAVMTALNKEGDSWIEGQTEDAFIEHMLHCKDRLQHRIKTGEVHCYAPNRI